MLNPECPRQVIPKPTTTNKTYENSGNIVILIYLMRKMLSGKDYNSGKFPRATLHQSSSSPGSIVAKIPILQGHVSTQIRALFCGEQRGGSHQRFQLENSSNRSNFLGHNTWEPWPRMALFLLQVTVWTGLLAASSDEAFAFGIRINQVMSALRDFLQHTTFRKERRIEPKRNISDPSTPSLQLTSVTWRTVPRPSIKHSNYPNSKKLD